MPGFVYLKASEKEPGCGLYKREGDGRPGGDGRPRGEKKHIDWEARMRSQEGKLTPELRADLAAALGLPETPLAECRIGYIHTDPDGECWTFAEEDGGGKVVGILRRFRAKPARFNSNKVALAGSSRGLIVPRGWERYEGPVFLPEGPSDTLALVAMGLPAIGRPNNLAGAELLAKVLGGVKGREVIVLGEYDPKPDGKWPGKEGAVKVAADLAARGLKASWALPPDGAKDVRHWATSRGLDTTCLDAWGEAGQTFVGQIERNPDGRGDDSPFPDPIPASQLTAAPGATWLWHGYLPRGGITLLSALWKAGKTTLLAHLLKAMGAGGEFCGLQLDPGRVLYVTEESQTKWVERRDKLGIKDHVEFQVRPFAAKPDRARWEALLAHVRRVSQARAYDLVVFDPLSSLWPVRDENDAAQVQEALMPLHALGEAVNAFLVHHNRKADGQEATAARGSGALAAFVDTIVELRRYDPRNRGDRKRVLTGYGRYDETPDELVIELTEAGQYVSHGSKFQAVFKDLSAAIGSMLPCSPPGLTQEEILERWPGDGERPQRQRVLDTLREGVDRGDWHREGAGRRGNPFSYWVDAPA